MEKCKDRKLKEEENKGHGKRSEKRPEGREVTELGLFDQGGHLPSV